MFISFYLIDMLVSILFQSEYKHCDMKKLCMLNYISNFVDLFWNYLSHTGFLVFRNELRSSSTISSPCSISDDPEILYVIGNSNIDQQN
jgi:hypothetical protein